MTKTMAMPMNITASLFIGRGENRYNKNRGGEGIREFQEIFEVPFNMTCDGERKKRRER